jgi:hypothetical protein
MFFENETRSYYVTDKGVVYSVDEYGNKLIKKIHVTNNKPFVYFNKTDGKFKSINVKGLVAKYFMSGYQTYDRIIQVNGDPYDCSIENLKNLSLEKRMKPEPEPKPKSLYSITELANELNVSTTTIQEVRKKLKISRETNEDGYKKIKRFINDVRRSQGKASLGAINDFLDYHKLEDYR